MRKTPNRAQFTSIKEMAEAFDYFLFDCDGVLWHGEEQHIGNAFRNIEYLESLGKQVYFVTNNSSISRAQMQKKMASDVFGYAGAKIDHLYPSGTVAA
jgi:4-nitrophenyl phosphatase